MLAPLAAVTLIAGTDPDGLGGDADPAVFDYDADAPLNLEIGEPVDADLLQQRFPPAEMYPGTDIRPIVFDSPLGGAVTGYLAPFGDEATVNTNDTQNILATLDTLTVELTQVNPNA